MAADDYHENSFIFKTITVFRIMAGVAVTLAVLFAMVWLIDYSTPRTAAPHNQQPLLVPDRADETDERKPRTFFETLLTPKAENDADSSGRGDTTPGPAASMPRRQTPRQPVRGPQPDAEVRGSEPTPGATGPQAPASGLGSELPAAAPASERTHAPGAPAPQATDGGVFAVQFGAFQQEERARQLSLELTARGYQPYVTTITLPDGTKSHRVRVGRFATREEATKLAAAIEKDDKISVFVTSK